MKATMQWGLINNEGHVVLISSSNNFISNVLFEMYPGAKVNRVKVYR